MTVTNTVALQLSGDTERLESESAQAFGFANLWTISIWLKSTQFVLQEAFDDHHAIFHLRGSTRRGEILIWGAKIEAANIQEEIYVETGDENGARLNIIRFNTVQKRNEWRNFSCAWDGISLVAYDQGNLVTDQHIVISGNGSMIEPMDGRLLRVGDHLEKTGTSLAAWSGIIGHIGIWDTVLGPDEFGPIISGGFGFNLLTNSGVYTSSASLKHYWRPGDDFPNVGFDYAGGINIASGTNATATGISNIVTDKP